MATPALALPQFVNSLGLHVLPGIVLVIVSSALLLGWEVMRLGGMKSTRLRWLLSCSGIALGLMSLLLIVVRFAVIQ
jgi:hypothetical protein